MSHRSFALIASNLTLATHDKHTNTINAVPLSVRYVIGDVIFLADFFMKKTRLNIQHNAMCTLVAREGLEGYQFKGNAHYIDQTHDDHERLTNDIMQRFPERKLYGIIQFNTHTEYSVGLIGLV